MRYILKHFDTPLLEFEMRTGGLEGLSVTLIASDEKYRPLFPLDLALSDKGLLAWLKQRTIPRNRAFVQQFLAKLGLNVNDTQGIINLSKGLSLNDCYWVVAETFTGSFDTYNLYDHRFDRALSLIAYTGYGNSQNSRFSSSPELTTGGMLAKAWRRINHQIILYKAGTTGAINTGNEPYSEFYACQIAQRMELKAVTYHLKKWKGRLCSTCELFTSKALSYIHAGRIVTEGGWPAVIAYYKKLGEEYYQSLLDMLIFDAVICNEDRHFTNFGLLLDSRSNTVLANAPIFDNGFSLFNYATDEDFLKVEDYAATRLMASSHDFVEFARMIITPAQKAKLRKLINFRFEKHARYNLPARRLKAIEHFIQHRVQALLAL